jgi:hypothetical protein
MQEKDVLLGVLEYHYRENLARILPYIENGVFFDPSPIHPGPVVIGKENKNIKPCFVLINGTSLVKDLRNSSLIDDTKVEYSNISSGKDFVEYLLNIKDEDGAAIFEEYSRIGFLGIIDPQLKKSVNLRYSFPDNYLSDVEGVDVPLSRLGGRTLVAAGVVQKFNYARACIVKSTGVNETATGSISYFGPNGLEEKIIFRHAPELRNQTYKKDGQEHPYTYLDDGTSIMGVHRKYTKIDGNFVLLDEQYIGMSGGSFVLQPSANEYSSIEDSLTSPLPQSGTEESDGYRSEIEVLVSGTKKVNEPCYSN